MKRFLILLFIVVGTTISGDVYHLGEFGAEKDGFSCSEVSRSFVRAGAQVGAKDLKNLFRQAALISGALSTGSDLKPASLHPDTVSPRAPPTV